MIRTCKMSLLRRRLSYLVIQVALCIPMAPTPAQSAEDARCMRKCECADEKTKKGEMPAWSLNFSLTPGHEDRYGPARKIMCYDLDLDSSSSAPLWAPRSVEERHDVVVNGIAHG